MNAAFLLCTETRNGYKLQAKQSQLRDSSEKDLPSNYRISPIFPVHPDEAVLPKLGGSQYIGFFFYEQAFCQLGKIVNSVASKFQKDMWFTHGLASIVIFGKNKSDIETIRKDNSKGLRAFELWHVKDHKIRVVKKWLCRPTKVYMEKYCLINFQVLPPDIVDMLTELQHCIYKAVALAEQFIPTQLVVYEQLAKVTNEIIEELIFLKDLNGTPPSFLKQDF